MKRIWKKNQVILTLLAVMIAVAGYLTYTGEEADLLHNNAETANEVEAGATDISDEDILLENQAVTENVASSGEEGTDSAAAGAKAEAEVSGQENVSPEADGSQPGEAVLTNGSISSTAEFMDEMQLNREQVRTKNKETLLEIIDNPNISDEQKQSAIDAMLQMTDIAEKENATETLLSTKGFENTVVSINEESVDVVIGLTSLTDAERAQIEDIVKRKTECSADKITISLMPAE